MPAARSRPDALPPPPVAGEPLSLTLLRQRLVAPHEMLQALAQRGRHGVAFSDALLSQGRIDGAALSAELARHHAGAPVRPDRNLPDPRLIARLGPAFCLREAVLPWRGLGAATIVLCAAPERFDRVRPLLEQHFGEVILAVATRPTIEAALLAVYGREIGRSAETKVPDAESCRHWGGQGLQAGLALLVAAALLLPSLLLAVLGLWAVLTLALSAGLKLAAALAALRPRPPEPEPPLIARLPVVSVIVALYHEADIAPRLVARLSRLDYPRDLLDILLVVEAGDRTTRAALAQSSLPPWMRVVVSPAGRLRTKPRALNVALDHCRGSIIGVYDAEDAPAPDQIRRVVERFHRRGPQVACLQGVLDFYNPRSNWLSRCFTIEYASWFRLILPGLERLGLAVPLGGTTLFFRRAALEALGGWDAHNVTEDADLGMRLARHGFRTELIDTVTEEEANCRPLPWVRQRSRWLKGYMMTWAVHMREPALLWRQLGPRRFAGFQVLFLCTLSQFLLAPLLWSFWLLSLGLPHPASSLPEPLLRALVALFVGAEAVNILIGILALRLTRRRLSPLWVPTTPVYYLLGALASYKAGIEMLAAPFYWDKTSHGHFPPTEPPP
ncbi:cellulose synthase/poly-beta-1,6-N-acetylglucosamine synthase-like glycosyltransferase [Cereibacter changlensis]|uniref:Cellulose synthase/poly-beta-1,6-N-acetylglucosamine synthase-like glycosyltransferase n=3 Tax=Cereibacter changlensis TaxID=402884 RepID=A0A2W7R0A9_9RHOB|nr:glycosyltransferase [Cereibacter changlensis]PZX53591.1 cellulose synthase/poly-beta-1,6-N-acetylglucosamine synthase-like glycosyltransferase [Cereibacter changlensis]